MTGTTLSHYRIVKELGRGGMGIVYLAEDTKLDRQVAIKVLPSSALASEDDRARFYREAKAAAALNHPNIAQIYQIDEAVPSDAPHGTQPSPFIAMEYIDGEPLDARTKRGPLKLSEAVRIATQIAGALGEAHEKGIVHRDVKASNVMLTSKGDAKVLDFGLALTAASTKLTRMGSTLGTVAYMSPEQARGEEVDRRTDLWALGVVLYEMVAGRNPFGGDYEQAVVYSILNAEPEPLTAVRTGVPMELEAIINKALRKDRGMRYQTAADLVADLVAFRTATHSGTVSAPSVPAARPTRQTKMVSVRTAGLIAVGTLVIGLAASLLMSRSEAPREPFDISLSLPGLEAKVNSGPAVSSDLLSLSPDGNKVAYLGIEPEEGLYVRDLTTGAPARRITGPAETPAFSPDSRFVAYSAAGSIYRAGLLGDAPERIADNAPDIVGLHWAEDGFLYYASDYATGISRVGENGGRVEVVTVPDTSRGELGHVYPEMLPNGRTMLFTAYSRDGYELRMLDMDTGRIDRLGPGVTPHFIEPDLVVFAQGPRLLAARLDIDARQLSSPVVISEGIYHSIASFSTNLGVSQKGDIVFIDGNSTWNIPLEIRRWDGSRETIAPDVSDITNYVLSPDGRFIAMNGQEAVRDPDIYLYELASRDTRQLTTHPLYDSQPLFSRDGSTIWFASERDGPSNIHSIDVQTGRVQLVYKDATAKYPSSAAPDDSFLLFVVADELRVLNMTGDARPEVIQTNLAGSRQTDVSPDSRWIAFAAEINGDADIYVTDYPETRPRQRITVDGGIAPKWSADGRYIYFKRGTELFRVPINASGGRAGSPERVMEGIFDSFMLLPDGSGILVRATPPRRTVRYIQDAASRIRARLDVR